MTFMVHLLVQNTRNQNIRITNRIKNGMQTDKGIVLARALIEHLRRQSVIVPALNAVERASAEAITRANRRLYDALAEPLTDVHRRRLDDLLKRRDNGKTTWLAWLRQSPVKPNSRHMENIALIGIDLGKNSFHIHCQDRRGKAVYRKKFTRPKLIEFLATCPATTIAMEACGGSHFMARKLEELGHSPKLISPQFVRPFVKSNKNDFVDAEAICEAASRPSMRFVQPRTESQQAMRALHRVRESLVQDKVKTTNQMHAFLLEFGISVPRGAAVISRLSTLLEDNSLPLYLSQLLLKLQQHYHYLVEQIKDLESQLKRKLDEDEVGQRLLSIPCVGTLTASTISTEIGDGKQYASSRDFAAATGLVPRQYSTGGRTTLLGISKRGNKKIRTLLVQCARVFIQKLEHQSGKLADWVRDLLCRKSNFVVTCALANKLARIAWALTARQQTYVA